MVIHNPILTGSFTVNNIDVSSITSSAANITALNATTASLNSFSASVLSYTASQNILNGTYTLTSSFVAQTASFTAFSASVLTFTGSASTRLGALEAATASLHTATSSFSGRIGALESYTSSLNNKTSSFATTGSNTFVGSQVISGSLTTSGSITSTSTITAQTLVVQTITSSVVYSSGSNIFGNAIANTQTFTGSVLITGSLTIAGGSSASSYSGATIFGSTIACSPIGCFATSCATSFIGGTMSGTTIYGSTAVCSPVGKFTTCIDAGSGTFTGALGISTATGVNLTYLLTPSGWNGAKHRFGVPVSGDSSILSFNWNGSARDYAGYGSSVIGLTDGQITLGVGSGADPTTRLTIASTGAATFSNTITGTTIYGSTAVCSPIGCFTTSCATSFIGGTMSGTTIYGSTAVCSAVGLFSGCVGIGSTSPTAKLHVYCAADVWHTRIGSACGELRIGGDTASGAVIQSYTPAGVVRDLYIQRDGGNIGIGTNCALSKVHIYASCANGAATPNVNTLLLIDSNNHQLIEMRTCSSAYGAMQGIAFTDNGLNAFVGYKEYTCTTAGTYGEAMHLAFYDYSASDPNNGIYFGTSTTPNCGVSKPLMFIKGNGNIGISTCTPEYPLHIKRYVGSSGTLMLEGNNNVVGMPAVSFCNNNGGATAFVSLSTSCQININGSLYVNPSANGNVAVLCKLIPYSNYRTSDCGYGGIDFYNNGKGYGCSAKFYTFTSTSGEWFGMTNDYGPGASSQLSIIACSTNGNIAMFTGNTCTERMRITPDGTVCIGGGNLVSTSNYKAHTYCQLTSPIGWCATVSTNTFTSFSTTGLGLPSGVKAIQVLGWYHITGYSVGAGQGDHAASLFGVTTDGATSWGGPSAGWPGGCSCFQNTNWGSFVLWHDGDASNSNVTNGVQYFGFMDSGVVSVHSNGNVCANLAHGLSGGTHYISLQIQGFWI